ncbi:hypothetical protein J4458_04300 [Candidatus Woesearchaeota archaeon]|nr:hypothetical protein [Candidatus Woesearchaeota archaeon]
MEKGVLASRICVFALVVLSSVFLISCNKADLPPAPNGNRGPIGKATGIYEGYGVPFDVFNNDEPIFTLSRNVVNLEPDQNEIFLGLKAKQEGGYIFKEGWYFTKNGWKKFLFPQDTVKESRWIADNANVTLNIPADDFADGENYVVAYSCKKYDGAWKCGCTSQSGPCNQWMIQNFLLRSVDLPPEPLQPGEIYSGEIYMSPSNNLFTSSSEVYLKSYIQSNKDFSEDYSSLNFLITMPDGSQETVAPSYKSDLNCNLCYGEYCSERFSCYTSLSGTYFPAQQGKYTVDLSRDIVNARKELGSFTVDDDLFDKYLIRKDIENYKFIEGNGYLHDSGFSFSASYSKSEKGNAYANVESSIYVNENFKGNIRNNPEWSQLEINGNVIYFYSYDYYNKYYSYYYYDDNYASFRYMWLSNGNLISITADGFDVNDANALAEAYLGKHPSDNAIVEPERYPDILLEHDIDGFRYVRSTFEEESEGELNLGIYSALYKDDANGEHAVNVIIFDDKSAMDEVLRKEGIFDSELIDIGGNKVYRIDEFAYGWTNGNNFVYILTDRYAYYALAEKEANEIVKESADNILTEETAVEVKDYDSALEYSPLVIVEKYLEKYPSTIENQIIYKIKKVSGKNSQDPKIHDNKISFTVGDGSLRLYDIKTDKYGVIEENAGAFGRHDIFSNYVVYHDLDVGLRLFDYATDEITQIEPEKTSLQPPRIYGDYIVYSKDSKLILYSISTKEKTIIDEYGTNEYDANFNRYAIHKNKVYYSKKNGLDLIVYDITNSNKTTITPLRGQIDDFDVTDGYIIYETIYYKDMQHLILYSINEGSHKIIDLRPDLKMLYGPSIYSNLVIYSNNTNTRILYDIVSDKKIILNLESIYLYSIYKDYIAFEKDAEVYIGKINFELFEGIGVGVPSSCTDSDGGKNIYLKGTITTNQYPAWNDFTGDDVCAKKTGDAQYSSVDSCEGDDCYIREYSCKPPETPFDFIQCPNGCQDGACVVGGFEDYPDFLMTDGKYNGILVVGDKSSASDIVAMVDIATSLQYKSTIEGKDGELIQMIDGSITKLASEVDNLKQNIISVGHACANAVTTKILGNPENCTSNYNEGQGKLQLFINDGYYHILVGGYSDKDAREAAKILANWKDNKEFLKGKLIEGVFFDPFSNLTKQIEDLIINDLITGDKKISVEQTNIIMDKGTTKTLLFGVRNNIDTILNYKIEFVPISGPNGSFSTEYPDWFQFDKEMIHSLPSADYDVMSIRLSIPSDAQSGSYLLEFDVVDDANAEIYSSKEFFVVVKS